MAVVTVGVFWLMAAIAYIASVLIPGLPSMASLTAPKGFDYVGAFQPFFKTFLLWVAGILFALGPFTALWFAAERGGSKLLNRALGRDDSH